MRENFDIFDIIFNPSDDYVSLDREKYLGGSDVANFTNNYKIYETVLKKANNNFMGNKYTENGHITEPFTRKFVNNKLGYDFEPCVLFDEELKLRANTDGFMVNSKGENVILEIKNNNDDTSYANFEKYFLQMQFYMYMYNAKHGILAELKRTVDENGEFSNIVNDDTVSITKIERDEKVIKNILNNIKTYNEFKEKYDKGLSFNEIFNNKTNEEIKNEISSLFDLEKLNNLLDMKHELRVLN